MGILQDIDNDLKEALKKKEEVAVSTIRMLKAALHNRKIEKKGEELSETEVLKVIAKQIKQREDSIEQFKKGGRQELVDKETEESEVLKRYVPEQMSDEEVAAIVKKVIEESGAKDKKDFGNVMKAVMTQVKGRADGKLISQMVSQQLGS